MRVFEPAVIAAIVIGAYFIGLYSDQIEPKWVIGALMGGLGVVSANVLRTRWST